ncbi:MAG TPA: DUF2065 domain-containing protein [Chitinolyticbacter sp.]|uniref:DUF2065 domain-containing protein n=1 Tax=Chitinolyticbacter albus TaxID=2961951 RepID=UPI00210B3752|nr:DUF2065 domain-containing protein [Chitinolyticbacter albus]HSC81494.1 DUF2065 domain-containing protein [Chitinolyticbacter sp.]
MSGTLLLAFALVLVFEGILPFAAPAVWKRAMSQVTRLSDRQVRIFGFAALMTGLILALAVH